MNGAMSDEARRRAEAMFAEKEQAKSSSDGPAFNMEGYLDRYKIRYEKHANGDVTKYILLDGCLFNESHEGKDAAIIVRANGAMGYHCFHDGCSGKHWADARKGISGNDNLASFVKGGQEAPKNQSVNKPDPADPSIFLSVSSLLDVEEPNRPDLWEGEIPQGSLVGISGLWGSMKSLLMQAAGLKAAQGQPFLGRRLVETDVFYFDLENPRSAWKGRMLDLAGQDRPERFHMMTLFGPVPPPRFDSDGIIFYSKLAELHPGSLFIFDSLVRFYPSGKQSENTEDAIHAMTTLKTLTRWTRPCSFCITLPRAVAVSEAGVTFKLRRIFSSPSRTTKRRSGSRSNVRKNRFEEGMRLKSDTSQHRKAGFALSIRRPRRR